MSYIKKVELGVSAEALTTPFGFKGSRLTCLWNVVVRLTLNSGEQGTGLSVQSVLWSDSLTFYEQGEDKANQLMLSITKKALEILQDMQFTSPIEMLQDILPKLNYYAAALLLRSNVPQTLVLNALVAVDYALWKIWASLNSATTLRDITNKFCPAMTHKHERLCAVPLISYNTGEDEIKQLLDNGCALLKIKIGSNPNGHNNANEMLKWDCDRLSQIHTLAKNYQSKSTVCKKPVYYLDANGRYPSKQLLSEFIKYAEDINALHQIILLEEPFAENSNIDVSNLPINIAGDESAHSVADVNSLTSVYGYKAIACKPIAKTLSVTLQMIMQAYKTGADCFCADLTVPPAMLDQNMAVAAHLPCINGMIDGIVETNGAQNYVRWEHLDKMAPTPSASWRQNNNGIFTLNSRFYEGADIFKPLPQYEKLLRIF